MNNYLKIGLGVLASTVISLIVFVLSYNYFPINIFDASNGMLGSTVTTINAGDTLKDSRSVINTNFTNLNTTKVENTTTTFPSLVTLSGLTTASLLNTIGTIVSGIWHGTIIDVLYGGTGRSTLTANTVLLGNGTSGIATTTGGTDGQLLTYSSSSKPYWGSPTVDQTVNYSWTGAHTFASTTTFSAPTNHSATSTFTAMMTDVNSYASSTISTTTLTLSSVYQNTGVRPLLVKVGVTAYNNAGAGATYTRASAYIGASTTVPTLVDDQYQQFNTAHSYTSNYTVTFIVPVNYYYKITGESTGSGASAPGVSFVFKIQI